ncbi:MAG TPA: ribbon-helix-helix protein, CopG family [Marinagarivorans sp.]
METTKDKLSRISISLPESLLLQLDQMVTERDCDSRSQAIVDMIHKQLAEYFGGTDGGIMAGSINIVFDSTIPNVQKQITELQQRYADEVVSTLNINIDPYKIMSIIVVLGVGSKLKKFANSILAQRGVITGKLVLSAAITAPAFTPIYQPDLDTVE